MIKKYTAVLILAAAIAGGAFALPEFKMSAGGGVTGVSNWESVKSSYAAGTTGPGSWVGNPSVYMDTRELYSAMDMGGFVFFDATYAEFDISLGHGKMPFVSGYNAFKMGLSLFVKAPFTVGDSGLTIALLLGVQYDMVLGAKDQWGNRVQSGSNDGTGVRLYDGLDGGGSPKYKNGSVFDFSTFSPKAGLEVKYPLSERLYLSTQALWGIRFNSAYTKAQKNYYSEYNYYQTNGYKQEYFTHGVTFKVALGYTFKNRPPLENFATLQR